MSLTKRPLTARAKRKLVADGVLEYYGLASNSENGALFLCHALEDISALLGKGPYAPKDCQLFADNRPVVSIPEDLAADFELCYYHLRDAIRTDIDLHVERGASSLSWSLYDYEFCARDEPAFFHNRLAYLQFLLLDYVDNGALAAASN